MDDQVYPRLPVLLIMPVALSRQPGAGSVRPVPAWPKTSTAKLQAYAGDSSGLCGSANRRRQFPNEVAIKKTQHLPRLFREATQLKTVGAVVRAAGREPRHVEIQVHAIDTADRRRPAVTAVADVAQRARGVVAVARGGAAGCGVEAGIFRMPSVPVYSERQRN